MKVGNFIAGRISMQVILEVIVGIVVSVATTALGIVTSRLQKSLKQRELEEAEEKERRERIAVLTIEGVQSAIALGEANTIALKRGSSNGESEQAMAYAREIKHKIKDFLIEQGARER
ncbi:MAG: serine/threonine protein kinase [Clostridia bacterium]|nr:serine/threonine protein kinase [Clostridia bacterium]